MTGFISNTFVEHREKLLGFATFNTPSLAMDKRLVLGDYFISDTWKYKNHLPKRGEVFVFKYPLKPEINYIKRLIGLPNDRIRIENNKVYVNGPLLNESYLNPENNLGRGLPDATYVVL
ncbi:MAG: signal peptidase I [Candidatus Saccharibacteria bacterium]|nr:signal peptidase I [Moraxellaceae bacterium]